MQFTLESLAQSLADSADPAFAVDGEGAIIAWNKAAEAAFGYSGKQAIGQPCHLIVRGKDVFGDRVCRRECIVRRNIRQGVCTRRIRMHVRVRDGHHVEAECDTLCIRGTAGELAIIHLLHLWPGRGRRSPTQRRRGEAGSPPRSLPSLTHRQKEVLKLLAAGKSTREMAEHLFLSQGTVRTHVENILRTLDVHSRLEAVILASRENLV